MSSFEKAQIRDEGTPSRADGSASAGLDDCSLFILLSAVVLVSASIRIVGPAAFPEIEADEGLWTNSSKNFLLFGEWFMDGRTHMLLSPLFHAISVVLFRLTEPSIAAAREISAVAGALSVILLHVLVHRLTGRRDLAVTAAALFGLNQWAIVLSRRAMIEPVELCLMLLAAVTLVARSRWAIALAAVAMAMALLAKVNAAFFLGVLAMYCLMRGAGDGRARPGSKIWQAISFTLGAVGIAAVVYGVLYRAEPERFIKAFLFELDGVHFESLSNPIFRVGRFGLDPVQASRTMLQLLRETPFLIVLAVLGVGSSMFLRERGSTLFALWLGLGLPFFLGQMFQPLRYFFLLSPALAYFAALAIMSFRGDPARRGSTLLPVWALVITCFIEIGYVGMNALVNRAEKTAAVSAWVESNTRPDDRIMAAAYLCTDLKRRAYAHYHYARSPEDLLRNIRELGITYLVVDDDEWNRNIRELLDARFNVVMQWDFGRAYRVTPESLTHGVRRGSPAVQYTTGSRAAVP